MDKASQFLEDIADDVKPDDMADLKTSNYEIIGLFKNGVNKTKFKLIDISYVPMGMIWTFKYVGDSKIYSVLIGETRLFKRNSFLSGLIRNSEEIPEGRQAVFVGQSEYGDNILALDGCDMMVKKTDKGFELCGQGETHPFWEFPDILKYLDTEKKVKLDLLDPEVVKFINHNR